MNQRADLLVIADELSEVETFGAVLSNEQLEMVGGGQAVVNSI